MIIIEIEDFLSGSVLVSKEVYERKGTKQKVTLTEQEFCQIWSQA